MSVLQAELLKAPYPYFGGKSRAAETVWRHLGDVKNYCEPFCGSAAVLLARPHKKRGIETVNDIDGLLINAYRAIQLEPEATAAYCDWPVTELDLTARHRWLKAQRERVTQGLANDPGWCDPKAAGWWIWGINIWIGGNWCQSNAVKLPHLGNGGTGVHKISLGGGSAKLSRLSGGITEFSTGAVRESVEAWFLVLSERLRKVRMVSGDWMRICTPSVTTKHGLTGIFFDPPYNSENACNDVYATKDDKDKPIAVQVREWCLENQDDPLLRLALSAYDGDHDELEAVGWYKIPWKACKGYQKSDKGRRNGMREVIYFSPNCVNLQFVTKQSTLNFEAAP